MSLRKADRTQLEWIMGRTPTLKENAQWGIFLRNHDELTLEMVTEDERQWMWEQFAPEPRMRLNLGIRRRLAPLVDNDPRQIALLNSMLFTFPGSPILYYGDEIGMGDNIWLPDRNGVRTLVMIPIRTMITVIDLILRFDQLGNSRSRFMTEMKIPREAR